MARLPIVRVVFLGAGFILRHSTAFAPRQLPSLPFEKITRCDVNPRGFCRTRVVSAASEGGDSGGPLDIIDPLPASTFDLCDDEPVRQRRWVRALPRLGGGDELDRVILATAIPSMINLGVVPLVNAVDTYWVGRLGIALALAGQSAANQVTFTLFFLVAFLPNITAPLVATAVASGDTAEARARVSESVFLCAVLGAAGTAALVLAPRRMLGALVLPAGAPAMEYAAPYLRWRALGMVPALISATGFAAYRGLLNTVTPLKVSLLTNSVNLLLDPLCIFGAKMGFVGAAVATAASELLGGLTYLRLLFRRKLASWATVTRPPSWKSLAPLLQGGAALLVRQLAINVGLIAATRRAQVLDPSGVSGAAYGICMQIYSVGLVILIAVQGTAAALVPANLAKCGEEEARRCADRIFAWGSLIGVAVGAGQCLLLPYLVPLFSTLPEVREAVRVPALILGLMQIGNGPVFAGEGIMLGLQNYKDLAIITSVGIVAMIASLASPLGKGLEGVMWSLFVWTIVQSAGVVLHYLKIGSLAVKKKPSSNS